MNRLKTTPNICAVTEMPSRGEFCPGLLGLAVGLAMLALSSSFSRAASGMEVLTASSRDTDSITIVAPRSAAAIVVASNDFPVVQLTADLFRDDVQRV